MTANLTLGVSVSGPNVVSVRLALTVDPGDIVSDDPFVVGVRPVGTSGAWQTFTVYGAASVPFDVTLPTGTLSPPGAYAFRATQPSVGESNTVYAAVSAEGDDVWVRAVDGLMVKLAALAIPDILEHLTVQVEEDAVSLPPTPCLILALSRMTETQGRDQGTATDPWFFPVRCTVATRDQPNAPGLWRKMLNWRAAIRAALHNKKLDGVPEVYNVVVEPQFAFPPQPQSGQSLWLTTVLTARCQTKLIRG